MEKKANKVLNGSLTVYFTLYKYTQIKSMVNIKLIEQTENKKKTVRNILCCYYYSYDRK
jgi:hypothetical protein